MKHILPTELVNRVLAYLATRPYNDVTVLIKDIQANAVPVSEDSVSEVVEAIPE
jgi:hypothetical protein